ncbi:BZIP transcription factor [Rhynchospora pubera]|uniref:BZIP transcription factor n=1 Tax=Rhynchospora pubera TaxID=906938 RepID=A0AAV8CRC0_9POAL|nr:BZIP transcription factor [Rhynchospora pubera]
MASSRVTSPPSIFSPPIAEMPSPIPLDSPGKALGSMNMEDLLRNIYTDEGGGGGVGAIGGGSRADVSSGKTVDEVWREISSGKPRADVSTAGVGAVPGGEMTLEDFLAREDEGKPRVRVLSGLLGSVSAIPGDGTGGNGNGHSATGRGRKRQILDPIDRAAMQRQKRMIKNRESAARSRERKQAYVAELESLVSQLEEENAQLLRYQEEQHQRRLKQLMENLIPVTICKRPKRQLRRTNSMEW